MDDKTLYARLNAIAPTYPVIVPIENKEYPAITYSTVNTDYYNTLCLAPEGKKRVQISVFSHIYGDLDELQAKIRKSLNTTQLNAFDGFDREAGDNPEPKVYTRILEFYL